MFVFILLIMMQILIQFKTTLESTHTPGIKLEKNVMCDIHFGQRGHATE